MSDHDLTLLYFDQLTLNEVEKLHNIYQDDFNLFNYEFEFKGKKFPWIKKRADTNVM